MPGARRTHWRHVHEPDPYLRHGRHQSVRISEGPSEARPGTGQRPGKLDALELPGQPPRQSELPFAQNLTRTTYVFFSQARSSETHEISTGHFLHVLLVSAPELGHDLWYVCHPNYKNNDDC